MPLFGRLKGGGVVLQDGDEGSADCAVLFGGGCGQVLAQCRAVREAVKFVVDAQSLPRVTGYARQAGGLPCVPVFAVPAYEGVKAAERLQNGIFLHLDDSGYHVPKCDGARRHLRDTAIREDFDRMTATMTARAAMMELARGSGLTSRRVTIPAGAAMTAVRLCFDSWHERAGKGKYEDETIIAQAEAFMSVHAHGMRFSDWSDHHTNHDHAGYRKQAGEDVEYWINTKTFIEDICQGYDKDKVCEVLHGICWLLKNEEKGRWQHQRRIGKARRWYFVLANEAPPDTEE